MLGGKEGSAAEIPGLSSDESEGAMPGAPRMLSHRACHLYVKKLPNPIRKLGRFAGVLTKGLEPL